jgi:hypothetical protein
MNQINGKKRGERGKGRAGGVIENGSDMGGRKKQETGESTSAVK